jgi:hypothetical protein
MRNRFSRLTIIAVAVAALSTVALSAQTKPATPKAKAPKPAVTLTTKPTPPVSGTVEFHATVTDDGPDGKPVNGAVVSLTLTMPAMPMMKMPAMSTAATLKSVSDKAADAGKYVGTGKIPTPGTWDVTITVKVKGKLLTTQKLKLDVK